MKYRQLGNSGLRVSSVALGTMTFGASGYLENAGSTDEKDAARQVAISLDAGVNLFDTANAYSAGASETVLGKALGARRDEAVLATKVRLSTGDGVNDEGLSRRHIVKACEDSLRRLGTDYIDLYQVHEWDGLTPLEETLDALDRLVDAGKVRYVGCSNYSGWQTMKAANAALVRGTIGFTSNQIYYSLQDRSPEHGIVPAAVDQGIGLIVYSPLAGGLLTGKYRRGQDAPAGSRHLTAWDEPPVRDESLLYDVIDVLVEVAEANNVPASRVALAWVLSRPGVSSVIMGARTEQQLVDNLAAASLRLSDDDLLRLDAASRPPLPYPLWHQAKLGASRFTPLEATLYGEPSPTG